MANLLKFDSEARDALKRGINTVADAVGATLGPKGRNVAIERPDGPLIVHDGVTVARSIALKDPFEDQGAKLLIKTAQKTNDKAGDGTTTATILAQALCNEALKQIDAGANPQTLKKEIEDALEVVLEELKKLAKKVETSDELIQVATIASGNPELGKMVAEAIKGVGTNGVVTVEEGSGFETVVDYKQGMEIDRGYVSPHFVTNEATVEAVLEDAYILMTDLQISHNYQLVPFLESVMKEGKKNLMIFGNVLDEALATLVVNKLRGAFNVCVAQPPAFGGRRIDELEDMATLCGGVVITQDSGREIESVTLEELGRADKIISDRDKTVILNGKGSKQALKRRIDDLNDQITIANTDYDKDIKKQRMAKLSGGVAVINVGGITEVEVKEKKERVIDAVNATKAAIEEGIVAGGEMTLTRLPLRENIITEGGKVLAHALDKPFEKLIQNSGMDYTKIWVKIGMKDYPYGIDVQDGQVKDLIKAGIVDPVKVTRSALEAAVSIACALITTNVLIVDERDEK